MKILTNNFALRNSAQYLKNIGVEFGYLNNGVFELCQFSPDVIISDNYHEVVAASKKYPSIKFIGKDLQFPNYEYNTPQYLLDELSVLIKHNINMQKCTVAYFNDKGEENKSFIDQIRCGPNVKIMGPGYCIDELDRSFPQRLTPSFYNNAEIVAASSMEEVLKALFMCKPCVTLNPTPYCYRVNEMKMTLKGRESGVEYAWNHSHTTIWGQIFEVIGYKEYGEKLGEIINLKKEG